MSNVDDDIRDKPLEEQEKPLIRDSLAAARILASNTMENGGSQLDLESPEKAEPYRSRREKVTTCLRTNLLTILTIVGVVSGGVFGYVLKESADTPWSNREIMYVNFLGDIFLKMLKSLILPLIISSLISAVANLDLSLSGKIAAKAITYYMITTVMAIILGIILVITIEPGKNRVIDNAPPEKPLRNVTTADTLLDLVRNMFPPNVVEACIFQYRTVLTPPGGNSQAHIDTWSVGTETAENMNILGLVIYSVVIGITIAKIGEAGKPLAHFFQSLMTVMMTMTGYVIWLSPIGIFFLVSSKILEIEDFSALTEQLGLYFVTVLMGVLAHGLIVLPIIFFLFTRKNPIVYVLNIIQPITMAFGTASSSATLPITMQYLEEKNHIDPRVTRFVLPIGATINMDGTALYEAVAAIFIAQTRGIALSMGNIVAISITATAASIGAAGIPQAGLVTMVMVLDTVGLPAEDITIILAVDWLLDRFRTAINVIGDAYGAGIVDFLSRNELRAMKRDSLS